MICLGLGYSFLVVGNATFPATPVLPCLTDTFLKCESLANPLREVTIFTFKGD